LSRQELRSGVVLLQIERNVLRANAGQTAELVAQRDELVFGTRDEQHVSAACRELSGKRRSDSGRCSSDEGRIHSI
jgi:hypothetical protein